MIIQPPKHHVVLCYEDAEKFDPWPGDTVQFVSGKYRIGRDSELIPITDRAPESKRAPEIVVQAGAN